MTAFKALLIEERDGKTGAGFVRMDENQLDPGEVTIRVAFSSVNYKDALAATGAGRIIRRFPCVGGIDLWSRWPQIAQTLVHLGVELNVTGSFDGVTVTASVRVATSDVAASVTLTWMTARAAVLPSSTSVALKTRLFTQAVAWAAVRRLIGSTRGRSLPVLRPSTLRRRNAMNAATSAKNRMSR